MGKRDRHVERAANDIDRSQRCVNIDGWSFEFVSDAEVRFDQRGPSRVRARWPCERGLASANSRWLASVKGLLRTASNGLAPNSHPVCSCKRLISCGPSDFPANSLEGCGRRSLPTYCPILDRRRSREASGVRRMQATREWPASTQCASRRRDLADRQSSFFKVLRSLPR